MSGTWNIVIKSLFDGRIHISFAHLYCKFCQQVPLYSISKLTHIHDDFIFRINFNFNQYISILSQQASSSLFHCYCQLSEPYYNFLLSFNDYRYFTLVISSNSNNFFLIQYFFDFLKMIFSFFFLVSFYPYLNFLHFFLSSSL